MNRQSPLPLVSSLLSIALIVLSLIFSAGCSSEISAEEPATIMTLDEVRIGMKGYGLSVFHGTKIEPFAVEVVSIERTFEPKRAVIWIRCRDDRMQATGPVSGMSGSPIYLWNEGEEGEQGKKGRLIGAFAYGYSLSKDCYVGVQPIELMRSVGDRALKGDGQPPTASNASTISAVDTLQTLLSTAERQGVDEKTARRGALLVKMLESMPRSSEAVPQRSSQSVTGPSNITVDPLALPVSVPSARIAEMLQPLLGRARLQAFAGAANGSMGHLPAGIDADAIRFEPGSVLSIPLAWGDLDLAAAGTVTDVLPDGRVLAFGHAMFGQGPAALPIATGFVHFVQPNIISSFKMTASAKLQPGSLVRDEQSAVVSSPAGTFTAATMRVSVNIPGQKPMTYEYHLAHEDQLTPILAAICTMQSLSAVQDLPEQNTLILKTRFEFENGRTHEGETMMAPASIWGMVYEILPPIAMLVQNPFERVRIKHIDVQLDVKDETLQGSYQEMYLSRAQVAPGESVVVTARIKPHSKPAFDKRLEIAIPGDLPEGDYELAVVDSNGYLDRLIDSQPYMMNIYSVDDLFEMLQMFGQARSNCVYVMLLRPEAGLSIGRTRLPQLPSSRQAIMQSPLHTLSAPFGQYLTQKFPTDLAISGERSFLITVRKKLNQP